MEADSICGRLEPLDQETLLDQTRTEGIEAKRRVLDAEALAMRGAASAAQHISGSWDTWLARWSNMCD